MTVLSKHDNPVLWQERTHQERNTSRWARYTIALNVLLTMLMIGITATILINDDGYFAMQVALLVVWALQIATAVRGITAGANMVSREHIGQTWDTLVLTGLSARRILFGKWRAALHAMREWLLLLGVVRLAMLPIFSLGLLKIFAFYSTNRSYSYSGFRFPEVDWVPWAWMLAVVGSVVITILDILACTAIGILASTVTRRGIAAIILGLCIRFAPVVIFAAFVRYQLGVTQFWRWWSNTEFALSDAGTSALMVLGLPQISWTRGDHLEALPGLFLAMAMLAGLTVLSLSLTHLLMRRGGALFGPAAWRGGMRQARREAAGRAMSSVAESA